MQPDGSTIKRTTTWTYDADGRLTALGVARVSIGSGPSRAVIALTRRIGAELLQAGTYTSFTDDTISYQDANRLFQR